MNWHPIHTFGYPKLCSAYQPHPGNRLNRRTKPGEGIRVCILHKVILLPLLPHPLHIASLPSSTSSCSPPVSSSPFFLFLFLLLFLLLNLLRPHHHYYYYYLLLFLPLSSIFLLPRSLLLILRLSNPFNSLSFVSTLHSTLFHHGRNSYCEGNTQSHKRHVN
nr:unnamed protein product [Spirometra erinaceieuropaei]